MTTSQTLRAIVDSLDGHVRVDLAMSVNELAALAAELEALAIQVERMEMVTGIAAATLALERIEALEAKTRAAGMQ